MKRFEGKVVMITGAANGFGYGMALQCLEEGAFVAAVDLEADTLASVFDGSDRVLQLPCDISDYDRIQEVVAETVEKFGKIDVLLNNAGITFRSSLMDCPKDAWDKVMDVNLNGAFYITQAVAKVMVEKGVKGSIVNTASVGARKILPNTASYCPSKAGLVMMTKCFALELGQHGIRVNAFGPGSSVTRMSEAFRKDPERVKQVLGRMPLGRYGEVSDAVNIALFLASDAAAYITGETVYSDGGFCLP